MKRINFTVSQGETISNLTFELSEDKAKSLNIVIGTALNNFFTQLNLAKQLGARLFDARKECVLKVESDFVKIDSSLLNAGVVNAIKGFQIVFKPTANEERQKRFAQRFWAASRYMIAPLEVKTIADLTGIATAEILLLDNTEDIDHEEVKEAAQLPIVRGLNAPKRVKKQKEEVKMEVVANDGANIEA